MVLGTVSNSRRGGEVSRITVKKVQEGLNGEWILPSRVLSQFSSSDVEVMHDYMHFLVPGKKSGTEVDVVLHKAFKPAFEYLVDSEIRLKLGISPKNEFLFCNKNCKANISVRSRFEKACVEAGLGHVLKATDVRHYISTYLTEDMTDDEREVFFKFMGHSREISKNVYSCRPVLQTMALLSRIQKAMDFKHREVHLSDQASLTGRVVAGSEADLEPEVSLSPKSDLPVLDTNPQETSTWPLAGLNEVEVEGSNAAISTCFSTKKPRLVENGRRRLVILSDSDSEIKPTTLKEKRVR